MLHGRLSRAALLLWSSLVLLRLLVAFTSTSSIHPDEHFQNPEIAAGDVFSYKEGSLLRTWEWTGDRPCRSVAPVWGSTGAAFVLLKLVVGDAPSGRALFFAQRLWMWLLSLTIDLSIWRISGSSTSLLLFASSPLTFTFLLRPFSNSLETVLLAVTFLLAHRARGRQHRPSMGALGAVFTFGVWTRITFIAFAAPLLVEVALRGFRPKYGRFQLSLRSVQLGAPAVMSFVLLALPLSNVLTLLDTLYFTSTLSSPWILTPLNLLRYNLASSNLAEHGLHSRWLHAVVNGPILFGAGIWAVATVLWGFVTGSGKKDGAENDRLYLFSLLIPTLVLSLQPHQEPRFLLPLLVPLTLLIPSASFFHSGPSRARRRRRQVFWSAWLLHSLLFTVLFGYLHQGGLVPILLKLNQELRTPDLPFLLPRRAEVGNDRLELVFWKTFMPPRHLLVPLGANGVPSPSIGITDLAGSPLSELVASLSSLSGTSTTLLVTPAYLFDAVREETKEIGGELRQLFEGRTFGLHVDMDRIEQLAGTRWDRMGVGVWQVL